MIPHAQGTVYFRLMLGTETAYSTNTYTNKQTTKQKKTAKLGEGEESNFQRYYIIKFKRLVFNNKGTRHTKKQKIITHLKENNKATKLSLKKI